MIFHIVVFHTDQDRDRGFEKRERDQGENLNQVDRVEEDHITRNPKHGDDVTKNSQTESGICVFFCVFGPCFQVFSFVCFVICKFCHFTYGVTCSYMLGELIGTKGEGGNDNTRSLTTPKIPKHKARGEAHK